MAYLIFTILVGFQFLYHSHNLVDLKRKKRQNGFKWFAISCWLAEGASEEPGDEGADGSDEEPSVGRQRYVDTEEMTLYLIFWSFFFFLREGFLFWKQVPQVKRGMLDFQPEMTHNSSAGTLWLGHCQLKSSCHFFWVIWGLSCDCH